ncbi:TolB family protein, partial [candidate division KSB1 bacterium]
RKNTRSIPEKIGYGPMRVSAGLISLACLPIAICGCGSMDETANEDYKIIQVGQSCTKPDWVPDSSAITAIGTDFDWVPHGSSQRQRYKWLLNFQDTNGLATNKQVRLSFNAVAYHSWSNGSGGNRVVYTEQVSESEYRLLRLDDQPGTPVSIFESSEIIKWPSWTADNSRVAFLNPWDSNGIITVNSDGGSEPETIPNDQGWEGVSFCRCAVDGGYVIYIANIGGIDNVYKIDLAGGASTRLTDYIDPLIQIHSAEISPDGATLAYTSQSFENPSYSQPVIYLKSLPDGEPKAIVSNLKRPAKGEFHSWMFLAWAPDGMSIAAESVNSSKYRLTGTVNFTSAIYVVPIRSF